MATNLRHSLQGLTLGFRWIDLRPCPLGVRIRAGTFRLIQPGHPVPSPSPLAVGSGTTCVPRNGWHLGRRDKAAARGDNPPITPSHYRVNSANLWDDVSAKHLPNTVRAFQNGRCAVCFSYKPTGNGRRLRFWHCSRWGPPFRHCCRNGIRMLRGLRTLQRSA